MASFPVSNGVPRDVRAMTYLVSFIVTTVATILVIRAVLAATGYPQLGGNGLHIAHVLWGGLVLAVGVALMLSFVGPVVRPVAVVVCGIGFGLFLDEVGKFVTSSNNYFFKPAVAIIYGVTVLFVLAAQWIHGRRRPRPSELLASAVNEAVAGASGGISEARRSRALALVGAAGEQPGAAEAAALLRALPASTREPGDPLIWLGDRVRRLGEPFVRKRWLRITVVTVLSVNAALSLLGVLAILVILIFQPTSVTAAAPDSSALASIPAVFSAACVVMGIRYMHHDPARGYAWLERAILVDLLLTQPIVIAADEFSALPSIVIDLIMLAVVATARAAASGTQSREQAVVR